MLVRSFRNTQALIHLKSQFFKKIFAGVIESLILLKFN
jgi:hypothetical protein